VLGRFREILRFSTLTLLTILSSSALASGYKMEFQSASVLADAGEAAVVEDAGTNWYNSAGLVYLPHQFVGSVIDLITRTQFTGSVNAPNVVSTAVGPNFSAQGSADSYQSKPLPALHYNLPFKEQFAFGISIVPAWGLSENYGQSSFVRYELTRIYTKTIDISPSIAFKLNDKWSFGAGPDFNYLSLQSRFNINSQSALLGTTGDSISRVSGDDWNTGWHLGALFRPNECTRFGLNYRSKIVMHLTGSSGYFSFPATGLPENNSFTFHWVLPPTTTFSAYRDLNSRWALMGTIAYDQWNTLRNYNVQNYQTVNATPAYVQVPVTLSQGFRNVFNYSAGAHFKVNEQWLLRGSVKYEPTPTGDLNRDINFPDANKLGVQIGGRYQFNQKLALDLIYGHVFTKTTPIRPTPAVNALTGTRLTGVVINGHSTTSIDLVGAQIVWNI